MFKQNIHVTRYLLFTNFAPYKLVNNRCGDYGQSKDWWHLVKGMESDGLNYYKFLDCLDSKKKRQKAFTLYNNLTKTILYWIL